MRPSLEGLPAIRIATRGSALALVQAHLVRGLCEVAFPGMPVDLRILKTTGDLRSDRPLSRAGASGASGLFTKELENALSKNEADLAVHSLKDLPTELPVGLRLGAVLTREDVRDVLITRANPAGRPPGGVLEALPFGGTVATGSPRRSAQLRAQRADLRFTEIRGNVPTRLRKLAQDHEIHGTVLAMAGLRRLGITIDANRQLTAPTAIAPGGWGDVLNATILPLEVMLPAPGQAAIGIECRRGDRWAARICRALEDSEARACVEAERALLAAFGGGCQSPVAALATVQRGALRLRGVAFRADDRVWRDESSGPMNRPRELGTKLGRAGRRALRG